jgi:hypothetical protein
MHIKITQDAETKSLDLIALDLDFSPEELATLIQAGAQTNPDLPPGIKEFVDILTTGKIQQDYYTQVNKPRPL